MLFQTDYKELMLLIQIHNYTVGLVVHNSVIQ